MLLAIFLGAVFYSLRLYAPCDDAYIYLVYVKNLINGNGLTYNGMRVQGFTSILWVLLLSIGGLLIPAPLPQIAEAMSMASGLFVMAVIYRTGRRVQMSKLQSMMVLLLLLSTGDFVFYMGNGLETVFFSGMIVLSVSFLFTKDQGTVLKSVSFPVVSALTVLTRPEGALITVAIMIFLLWSTKAYKSFVRCVIILFVFLAPILLILRIYYGYWLPNTYFAKSGAGLSNLLQGLNYSVHFVQSKGIIVLFLIYVLLFRSKIMGKQAFPLFIIIAFWFFQVTVQGGDNMVGFRMFVPIVPLMYLLVLMGMKHVDIKYTGYAVLFTCFLHVMTYNFGTIIGSSRNVSLKMHAFSWRQDYAIRKKIGMRLEETFPSSSTVALNAAGIIPFYSGLRTIDMLGLNNEYIAHNGKRDTELVYGHQRGDGAYVLSCKPDIIILGGSGQKRGGNFISDREILSNPQFKKNYVLYSLPNNRWGYLRKGSQALVSKE
jgi:arabinofuranosyltransferase